jgi:hypothetical protein
MPNITMEGYYGKPTYKPPTYKPPTYKPLQKSYYREEPYDNSGAMKAAEQARLLREAQVRQAAQLAAQRQAEALRLAQQQKQAAIDRAAQSRISLGGGGTINDVRNAWNSYTGLIDNNWGIVKNAMTPAWNQIASTWKPISEGLKNAYYGITGSKFPVGYGEPGTTYYPGYTGGYPGAWASYPNQNMQDPRLRAGYGEDWGMAQMGNTANMMASGWQDQANWGRGVPTWEEVLKFADPNSFNPYDIAGHPLDHVVDTVIPETYYPDYGYDGYGGYGGGSYSSKPGYYGQNTSYGNRWYENLLQWNI